MGVKFSNNASTTLSNNITAVATSFDVVNASKFPTVGGDDYVYLTLSNLTNTEIIKVTDITSNTLTCERAQDNTTAAAFVAGDVCDLRVTTLALTDSLTEAALSTAEQTKFDAIEALADVTDATNVAAAGATMDTDFAANSILAANTINTPAALTIAEQRLVGRITGGNIVGLTAAQILTLISVTSGAEVNPDLVSQIEAEAGTATTERIWSALRVAQAIAALGSGSGSAFKNKIINGDFQFDQRSVSPFAGASNDYFLDRWIIFRSGTGDDISTYSQDSDTPDETSDFSLKQDTTTLDAAYTAAQVAALEQRIEGYNFIDAGFGVTSPKSVTLSFWVKSTKTGIFCVSLTNSANDRTNVAEYTVSTTNTWEKKSVTFSGDTTGTWVRNTGVGCRVRFTLQAGSNFHGTANDTWAANNQFATSNQVNAFDSVSNNFLLSRVQLEVGSSSTDFERRLYGSELLLCQRYFEIYGGESSSPNVQGYSIAGDQTFAYGFKAEKRATPTTAVSGTWTANNCGQPTIPGQTNTRHASIRTAVTATGVFSFFPNDSADRITFDSEL